MKCLLISFLCVVAFSQETIDGVLAVVGENIVTQSDFFEQLKIVSERRGISPTSMPIQYESLAKKLLSNIVDQLVLLEHAKLDTNIFIGDEEVKAQLDLQVSGFINNICCEAELQLRPIGRDKGQKLRTPLPLFQMSEKISSQHFTLIYH